MQTVNIGTGAGMTTITIGGPGDTVNIAGSVAAIAATNLDITDKAIVLNKGGTSATARSAGVFIASGAVDDAATPRGRVMGCPHHQCRRPTPSPPTPYLHTRPARRASCH
eukprot:tig00020531_g10023.t1